MSAKHPTPTARPPGGVGKAANWFRNVVRNIKERTIVAGNGIAIDHEVDGTRISLEEIKRGGGGEGGEGVNFAGVWDQAATYAEDDWVYLEQGASPYTPAQILNMRKHSGLYRSKVAENFNIIPGTDSDSWELIAEGPRSGRNYVDPDQTVDTHKGAVVNYNGLTVENDGTLGAVGAGFHFSESAWALWMAGGNGSLQVLDSDLDGGEMKVRTVYVAEGGLLKKAKGIITEPEAVSLE